MSASANDITGLFSSLVGVDDRFRSVIIGRIDQEISKLKSQLQTAEEARSLLTQGQVVRAPHMRQTQGQGQRGRPKGSRNKPRAESTSVADNVNSHRQAVVDLVRKNPGITSADLKDALVKSGHKIDDKVLYATIYNSMNKYAEIRKEGKPRSQKYFIAAS